MKKTMKIFLAALVISVLYVLASFTNIAIRANDLTAEQWHADFDYLKKQLPRHHINAFAKIDPHEWEQTVDRLKSEPDKEIALLKIVAALKDSHTKITNYTTGDSEIYPFEMVKLDDGYFISNADRGERDLIGEKVVSLNGVSINDVFEKFRPFIPYENENRFKAEFEHLSNDYRLLHHLGICDQKALRLETEKKTHTIMPKAKKHMDFLHKAAAPPCEEISASPNTVVLKMNVQNMSLKWPEGFAQRVVADTQLENLIIDLKDDQGGTYYPNNPLEALIKEKVASKANTKIYVLIGRGTFSSGVLQAHALKEKFHVTLVGEETGGALDHFGEVRTFHLPNSNRSVSYSTKYFNLTDGHQVTLKPDVLIPMDSRMYFDASKKKIYEKIILN